MLSTSRQASSATPLPSSGPASGVVTAQEEGDDDDDDDVEEDAASAAARMRISLRETTYVSAAASTPSMNRHKTRNAARQGAHSRRALGLSEREKRSNSCCTSRARRSSTVALTCRESTRDVAHAASRATRPVGARAATESRVRQRWRVRT